MELELGVLQAVTEATATTVALTKATGLPPP